MRTGRTRAASRHVSARGVRSARRAGKSAVEGIVNRHYPVLEIQTVSDAAEMYSLLVVTPTRLRVARWHNGDDIVVTYHAVRVVDAISRPKTGDRTCEAVIQQAPLEPGEWLLPLFGGTIVIDDVTITLADRVGELGTVLRRGRQYLLIGKECVDPNELISPLGAGGIFEIGDGGRILPSGVRFDVGRELGSIGSVSELRVQLGTGR